MSSLQSLVTYLFRVLKNNENYNFSNGRGRKYNSLEEYSSNMTHDFRSMLLSSGISQDTIDDLDPIIEVNPISSKNKGLYLDFDLSFNDKAIGWN